MVEMIANEEMNLRIDAADACPNTNCFEQPPAIFQVLPRGMYFGASKATSIDLSIRDLVMASRFRASTTILAETIDDPFPGLAMHPLPAITRVTTFARVNHVVRLARKLSPDLIIVQQHLPTAAAIAARLPLTQVILHTHNFQKDYRGASIRARIRRAFKKGRYGRLAGILHVSRACANTFAQSWPDLTMPSCIVHNGFDFDEWHPQAVRTEEILYVGRCAPEKGVLETANALAAVLPKFPAWQARLILSAIETHPDYFQRVKDALAGVGDRVTISLQRPFAEVKAKFETAAIALAPSHCPEAFGRTALEAHAGGAALISSGAGALAEVSDDCALTLPAVDAAAIARAIETLIHRPQLRLKLAHAAAKRVRDRFNIQKQAACFDDFCGRLYQLN